jgi:hypothetical protein
MRQYRQNFVYMHECIAAVQICVVSETAQCDWSDELDGNGVSANTMGLMFGSDVAGQDHRTIRRRTTEDRRLETRKAGRRIKSDKKSNSVP